MKKMSIKTSILLPSLGVLIAGVLIMVFAVGSVSSSTTSDLTERLVSTTVSEYSNGFESLFLDSYGISVALGPMIDQFTELDNARSRVINLLTDTLATNSNMLGIWTCWEPNAFDGRDSDYAGTAYHDATGRFIPYIYKEGNGYAVSALESYETPGDGDYYLGARNSGKPYITDPFEYPVGGKTISLCSIAVPIVKDGSVVGVIGVDISLESIIATMNAGSILNDGYLFTISPQGSFATHPNSDLVLKNYNTTWMTDHAAEINGVLANGGEMNFKVFSDQLNEDIRFFGTGIVIAETGRHWLVCGIVPERTVTASSYALLWLVIGIGLTLIAVVGLTIFAIVRMRLRGLPVVTSLAETIAKGDINLTGLDTGTDATHNEITLLGRAFAIMANGIKSQADTMERIAGGDYSVTISMRCEADVMNKAINKMLERFHEAMGGISASTDQVAAGSKQIADGAQSLAQGSTQQAAAVEQLSSSIAEITQKTHDNASMADKAARLAETIKDNAEKGSRQMDEMMTAVNEINQASQSINKVIKVIDDIAFQTNILALNAAVEAARAGQHGKGFAVVAEEVRNLAGKSAEAAKNTGEMIANSMEKAEQGARIAGETAASLTRIISGVNESSRLVGEIAKSSEEQSAGITQINKGIDQVAQVVQQNSATAQESAAASEEMSGQSAMLQDLIARFKLKDDGTSTSRMLGSAGKTPHKRLTLPEKTPHTSGAHSSDFGKY